MVFARYNNFSFKISENKIVLSEHTTNTHTNTRINARTNTNTYLSSYICWTWFSHPFPSFADFAVGGRRHSWSARDRYTDNGKGNANLSRCSVVFLGETLPSLLPNELLFPNCNCQGWPIYRFIRPLTKGTVKNHSQVFRPELGSNLSERPSFLLLRYRVFLPLRLRSLRSRTRSRKWNFSIHSGQTTLDRTSF